MTTEKQLDLLVRVLREDLSSSNLSNAENRIRLNLFEAGLLGWDFESETRGIRLTKAGMRALDDALVLFAPPFRRVNGAIDVEHERLLHVCTASQFGTTQEALCGFTPEHERGWDFPTDLEIAKLTTCPDCWNEKGAKKVR
jgi:hypothetical protein